MLWRYRWHIAYLVAVPVVVIALAVAYRLFQLQDVLEYDVRCQSVRVPDEIKPIAKDCGVPISDSASYSLWAVPCFNERRKVIGFKAVLYADALVRDGTGRLNRQLLALRETPCHTATSGMNGALMEAAGWFALCAEDDGKTLIFPDMPSVVIRHPE